MSLRFLEFELDPEQFSLKREGQPVPVERRVLDLILYLIRNRHRVVSREELLREVWAGVTVSDQVLSQALHSARRLLADDAKQPRVFQTLRGRGIRFVAEVAGEGQVAPLVGRELELELLSEVLGRARAEESSVVLIRGDAGVGKTRLALELQIIAAAQGFRVLWGQCSEAEGAPPFWPWVQLARELRTGPVSSSVADRVQPPLLADRGLVEDDQTAFARSRFPVMDGIASAWRRVARSTSVILVVDDLHRADESSFDLFEFVARELTPCRLVLVGAYRGRELRTASKHDERLAKLGGLSQSLLLDLEGLSRDAVQALAAAAGAELDESGLETLHRRTGGNPFFASQLIALMNRPGVDPEQLPSSVRAAVSGMLASVQPADAGVLGTASVFGRVFSVSMLAAATGKSELAILEAMDGMERSGLVERVGDRPGSYQFVHDLVREAVCSEMTETESASAHLGAKQAYEALGADRFLAELSYHSYGACSLIGTTDALEYALRAGRQALARSAFSDAVPHFERSIRLGSTSPMGREVLAAARLDLGKALTGAGRRQEAREHLSEVLSLAERTNDWRHGCEAALEVAPGVASLEAGFVDELAVESLRRALALVPEGGHAERARLKARLAMAIYWEAGSLQERTMLIDEAREIARRADPATRRFVEVFAIAALWSPKQPRARLEAVTELADAARVANDWHAETVARIFRTSTLTELGQTPDRTVEIERLEGVLRRATIPQARWYPPLYRASLAADAGDWCEVEKWSAEFARLGEPFEDVNQVFSTAAFLLLGAHHRGDYARLVPLLDSMIARYPTFFAWQAVRVFFLNAVGMGAQDDYQGVLERASSASRDMVWLFASALVAETTAIRSDQEGAARMLDLLRPHSEQHPVAGYGVITWGSTLRLIGRLHAVLGDWDQALLDLRGSRACETRAGSRVWACYSAYEEGKAHLARGDRQEAIEILASTRKQAGRLTLSALEEKAAETERTARAGS